MNTDVSRERAASHQKTKQVPKPHSIAQTFENYMDDHQFSMPSLVLISLGVYQPLGLLLPGLGLDSYWSMASQIQVLHVMSHT